MRRVITAITCAVTALVLQIPAYSQAKPEKVEGYVKRKMPVEWYREQAKLWRGEIDRNPQNADAWWNYYKAVRYSHFGGKVDWEKVKEETRKMEAEMEKAIPDTYEYHLIRWAIGGMDIERFPHLQRAYEIRQNYSELSSNFISYYETRMNREQVKFFTGKWYEAKDLAPGLLEYNYNVLMSLDKDAILFTYGDLDTYPIWMLQYAKGIRPDVTVINTSLILVSEYRHKMMKEHGIDGDPSKIEFERFATTPFDSCMAEFLKSVAEANTRRPVYFALSCDLRHLSLIKDDLYTVGLANRYSTKRLDNIALLKKNWEKFHLDYIDLEFYTEDHPFNEEWLPQMNMNYVAPAMQLYEHYILSGETNKAVQIREFALKIGRAGGQEKEVQEYIDGIVKEDPSQQPARILEKEKSLGEEISVYPNPASNLLTVRLPAALDAEVQLADLQGKVLRSQKGRGEEIRLDIEGIPSGGYMVRIITADGEYSKQVQVIR